MGPSGRRQFLTVSRCPTFDSLRSEHAQKNLQSTFTFHCDTLESLKNNNDNNGNNNNNNNNNNNINNNNNNNDDCSCFIHFNNNESFNNNKRRKKKNDETNITIMIYKILLLKY